jgi:hypothetical protein
MVMAAATTLALMAVSTSANAIEDLIARQPPLAAVIAPALTADEQATLREAMFRREQQLVQAHVELGRYELIAPDPHQQMAYAHLSQGNALRVGDLVVMHGPLLSALRPDTYAMAKHWQDLLDDYTEDLSDETARDLLDDAVDDLLDEQTKCEQDDPSCIGY